MNASANSQFGLLAFLHWNHDWNNWHFSDELLLKAIDQLKSLGVKTLRIDILWSDIHTDTNPFDYEKYDKLVPLLHQNGFELLVLLHYNKKKSGPNGDEWNRPPESFEEFANYVFTTVNRYKAHVRHWEIWNEPNHPLYWVAPPDNLKAYSRLLALSYQAAKRADPSCVVLNGGITEPLRDGLKNLYANGSKNFMDVLSIHTFIDPLAKDREQTFDSLMKDVLQIMKENGDQDKKIWITEMGCPGIPSGVPLTKWFGGEGVDEQQQADWVKTIYKWAEKYPQVQKIFWAFYRDTDKMFNEATDYFGLVRFDLTPKPSYYAMKELIASKK